MKYIQPMNAAQFSELLLKMKTDDVIEFGIDPGPCWPDETPGPNDVECWYFAKVIHIPGYDSRFILLDYCGGEEAFAIPLNNYRNYADENDRRNVPSYVKTYFDQHRELRDAEDYVFVELDDNDKRWRVNDEENH